MYCINGDNLSWSYFSHSLGATLFLHSCQHIMECLAWQFHKELAREQKQTGTQATFLKVLDTVTTGHYLMGSTVSLHSGYVMWCCVERQVPGAHCTTVRCQGDGCYSQGQEGQRRTEDCTGQNQSHTARSVWVLHCQLNTHIIYIGDGQLWTGMGATENRNSSWGASVASRSPYPHP
jgi:hypothetical protein